MVPVRLPEVVGVNVTMTVQVALAATVEATVQVPPEIAKSPDTERADTVAVALPLLVTVKVMELEVSPTVVSAKIPVPTESTAVAEGGVVVEAVVVVDEVTALPLTFTWHPLMKAHAESVANESE